MEAKILATEIVKKLVNAGYVSYFAGGWVRDYLMGHPSEDIDIATNAPPEVILGLFPRTILVGLAFGVIVVVIDGHPFEVATFRRDLHYIDGRKPTRIELASPEEDASRRDFTINGMFYDPISDVIHDFVEGMRDLQQKVVRAIGDPYERFLEDRLRMIRALRFSARFVFSLDLETKEAIRANAEFLFPAVAIERIWQEFTKMSKYEHFDRALIDMHSLGLLPTIFPSLKEIHLSEIKRRVASFVHFPKNAPTILYLLELFPDIDEKGAKEMCGYLKVTSADVNLAQFMIKMRKQVEKGAKNVEWTHIYANPSSSICLQVIAASMTKEDEKSFIEKHESQKRRLEKHIQRIIEKKPLISAALLKENGIVPSKLMGLLLDEAEAIAIENDFTSTDQILEVLKRGENWPIRKIV